MKVLITTNIPSPYFVDYANELAKYVDLTVVFELKCAFDRDKKWQNDRTNFQFKYVFLGAKKINSESGLSFKIFKYLNNNLFDRIIIANPLTCTGILAILYLKKRKIPYIIQSEGGFKGSGKGFKERLKKYLLKSADYYLTGMGGTNDYFMAYGGTLNRLKKYNFSSLKAKDVLYNHVSKREKAKIKKMLGIKYKNMILYVGQFIDRKDIPTLLKAFKNFDNNTCLILVGGNKTNEYGKIEHSLHLHNVFYIPFTTKEKTIEYFKAADIFVLPTKEDTWGLVINEAMTFGLPVISTNKSIAAVQLIENGINGYLVDKGDYKKINYYLIKILNNVHLKKTMSINNIKKMKDYTIEKMALTIYKHIKS